MRLASLVPVLLLALCATRPTLAAWLTDGTPQTPPATPAQTYRLGGLVADGSGGAYLVHFLDEQAPPGQDGDYVKLALQRVDILGNRPALWAAGGTVFKSWATANQTGTSSVRLLPAVQNGAGGVLLPNVDSGWQAEFVQQFMIYQGGPSNTVNPLGTGLFQFSTLGVAADGDGAGGLVWIGLRQTFAPPLTPPPPAPLEAQRVNAAGGVVWATSSLIPDGQGGSQVAALSDGVGGAFFAWDDWRDPSDPDLYLQHVTSSGVIAAGWPAGGVEVCGVTGRPSDPHLVPDGAGGVLVEWLDSRGSVLKMFLSHVLASGALASGIPVGGRQLASGPEADIFYGFAPDGAGGSLALRGSHDPGFHYSSFCHRSDDTGLARAGWPAEGRLLGTLTNSGFSSSALLPDGDGGAYVCFANGSSPDPSTGLYAMHLAGDGGDAPGWTDPGYRLSSTGLNPQIVGSGTGAIVAWEDYRAGASGIYAQRIVVDGPVATEISLASATADGDRVSLRWLVSGANVMTGTVERRTESSAWSTLAEVAADGSGYVAYEDRSVALGTRYGYRLVWRDGAITRTGGEVWLEVSGALALSIESPRPNPSAGAVSVALALPRAAPSRLQIVDVTGRRAVDRDLSALGAGRHVIALDEAAGLAPGVYLLRLVQGEETRTTRLLRVR